MSLTQPVPDTGPAIEVLARRRLELTHQRDKLTEAIEQVDQHLLTLLQPGETVAIDGEPAIAVRAGNRTWNERKAREVLPEQLLEAITVTEPRLDRTLAKEMLPPALYAECTTEGRPYVAKAGGRK